MAFGINGEPARTLTETWANDRARLLLGQVGNATWTITVLVVEKFD